MNRNYHNSWAQSAVSIPIIPGTLSDGIVHTLYWVNNNTTGNEDRKLYGLKIAAVQFISWSRFHNNMKKIKMYPQQFDDLLKEENIEQPQTLIFNKLSGALVAKMIGSHLDKVNTNVQR